MKIELYILTITIWNLHSSPIHLECIKKFLTILINLIILRGEIN